MAREANGLIGRTSMLNERAGQFYKAVHCRAARQLKTGARVFQSQKFFSCSAIVFVGLVESRETSESESLTFRVINIPKMPQAVMPSLFDIEVLPIGPFRLLHSL